MKLSTYALLNQAARSLRSAARTVDQISPNTPEYALRMIRRAAEFQSYASNDTGGDGKGWTVRDEKFYRDHLFETGVPISMHDGLIDYLVHGYPPGHFLTAVLTNNLKEAVARADNVNINALPEYVKFLYNHAPSMAWGSLQNVNRWLDREDK